MNSVEQKIFAGISDLNPDDHHRRRMSRYLSRNLDKDRLIRTAIREGVVGLLYKYLLEADLLHSIGPGQREKLEQIYYRLLYSNINLTHALKGLLPRLYTKDIPVVLLQGISLIHQIYGDMGLRPLTDIDLWVLPEGYPAFIDIMKEEGFTRGMVYPNTFRRGQTIIDVHTHVLWADRIPARKLIIKNGEQVIYRNSRIIEIDGLSARCLDPYDQVLYLSLHVLKHYVNRLIWLVDIKGLLVSWDQKEWASFLNRARELNQERVVSYLLFLLKHLLDFHPPEEIRQWMTNHRLNVLEKKILRKRINNQSLPRWAPVLLFSFGMGLRNRLHFLLESLFPNPEILKQIFAASSGLKVWRLYLKRLLQVFNGNTIKSER